MPVTRRLPQKRPSSAVCGAEKKFFISDAEKALNLLEGMSSRLDDPGDAEIESYIIAVHGIKAAWPMAPKLTEWGFFVKTKEITWISLNSYTAPKQKVG